MIVTGAGGKLGRLLRAAWGETPDEGICPVWTGRGKDMEVQWDILSGPVPSLPRGAVVLHLAGVVRGTDDQLRRNSAMVAPLLQACQQIRARALLFVSTAAVYGTGPNLANEDDQPAPASAYGLAKATAERVAFGQAEIAVSVLRLGNVPGADALLGLRSDDADIILDPVSGRDGGPVRSWIGPRSLANVIAALSKLDLPPILNVAAGPPLPMAALLQASGRRWRYGPPNPLVVADAVMDTRRLQALVPVPTTTAVDLAAQAEWARGVLA